MDINKLTMAVDAYRTTIGWLVDNSKIIKKIMEYIIKNDGDLNYEYGDTKEIGLVFITGVNIDEKELPVWDNPIIMNDVSGRTLIVSDIRKYVKPVEGMTNLENNIKDRAGYTFCVLRALVTLDYLTGNIGDIKNIERNIISGFVSWVSESLASKTYLNPGEKLYMEVAIAHYFLILMSNETIDRIGVDTIISKISTIKLSLPINRKLIEELVNKLNHNITNIDILSDNIETLINNGTKRINTNVIVNILNNSWFGHGGDKTAITALENVPTFIAMLYISITNKSYKNSRLSMIIDKRKRTIDTERIDKILTNYIKERTNTVY